MSSEKIKQIESTLRQAGNHIEKLQNLQKFVGEFLDEWKRREVAREEVRPQIVPHHPAEPKEAVPAVSGDALFIPMSEIRPSSWRYSRPTHEEQVKLKAHVAKRGQLQPIHVRFCDGRFEILDGHRVYDCMCELGFKAAWCVRHVGLTDEDAVVLALELNESRGELDHVRLAALFCQLVEKFGAAEVASHVGLTQDQVQSYAELINFDWKAYAQGEGEKGQSEMF